MASTNPLAPHTCDTFREPRSPSAPRPASSKTFPGETPLARYPHICYTEIHYCHRINEDHWRLHIETTPPPARPRVEGLLQLSFTYDQRLQQTRLLQNKQQPPLKVIRTFPLPLGGALLHLHNVSGGVLGGDQLRLDAEIGPRAVVQLTSTSATRIYRSRPEAIPARQDTTISIGESGLLEYLPDALIPFAGARYRQQTRIELAEDAGLFWWEIIAPGRAARNEIFAYETLVLNTELRAQGKPLLIERMNLEPAQRPQTSQVRMGPYTHMGSFYICRVGLSPVRWNELERTLQQLALQLSEPGTTLWGVSTLVAHGLVVRALSMQGRAIQTGLYAFWTQAKQALYGQQAIPPRKVY
jgi:urease accessory protein